jgi:hypothetical protein
MRPWRTLHIRQFIFNKSTGNKKIVFTLAYVSDSGLSVYLNRITLNLAQSEWINKLTYCFFSVHILVQFSAKHQCFSFLYDWFNLKKKTKFNGIKKTKFSGIEKYTY